MLEHSVSWNIIWVGRYTDMLQPIRQGTARMPLFLFHDRDYHMCHPFFSFKKNNFYCSTVALQCWVRFYFTGKWISFTYIYIYVKDIYIYVICISLGWFKCHLNSYFNMPQTKVYKYFLCLQFIQRRKGRNLLLFTTHFEWDAWSFIVLRM